MRFVSTFAIVSRIVLDYRNCFFDTLKLSMLKELNNLNRLLVIVLLFEDFRVVALIMFYSSLE